ncbi:hypothetical protein DB32_005137 [Sandaracinus amylolyticus]|uniref:Uncharacterized protein n=1 Tax=Sandaracinus amylolyticus TaxID=927083 RepID=A0A0F6YL70_9BACT|nr:hypothetical protein DB32_005137 [Sandaracinus amylolyticus]
MLGLGAARQCCGGADEDRSEERARATWRHASIVSEPALAHGGRSSAPMTDSPR